MERSGSLKPGINSLLYSNLSCARTVCTNNLSGRFSEESEGFEESGLNYLLGRGSSHVCCYRQLSLLIYLKIVSRRIVTPVNLDQQKHRP